MIPQPASDELEVRSSHWDSDLLQKLLVAPRKPTSGGWFMSWRWFDAWLTAFDVGYPKRLIIVRSQQKDETVAILPLYRKRYSLRWRILGEDLVTCPDHLDVICFDGFSTRDAWSAILKYIHTTREFHCLDLDHLDGHSGLLSVLSDSGRRNVSFIEVEPSRICHRIDLAALGSWDPFLRTLGANMRSNIKRRERKFNEVHSVEFESLVSVEARLRGLDELVELHTARWQAEGQAGAFKDKRFRFMLEYLLQCQDEGQADIRLFRLTADRRAVGLLLGMVDRREFFFFVSGYDISMREFSPGLILMSHVIKHAFSERFRTFDFLRGDEWYKTQWATGSVTDYRVRIYIGVIGACVRIKDGTLDLTRRARRRLGGYVRSIRRR